jgi:acetolactate synthase-1/2/3 large subunit
MELPPVADFGNPQGPLTLESIGRVIATLLPENAIIADEAVSSGAEIERHVRHAAPHDLLPVAGGAIGQGLPVAVGAALACPGRKVVALEADGSSMYTPQSLWTMARERLDVTVVLLANRRYRILEIEIKRTGSVSIGPQADALMDLHRPELDWVLLAKGMGVESSRTETAEDFRKEFAAAMRGHGPRLIEAVI